MAGIRRVHALAWRDLEDAEAGGSELFMSRVLGVWADAGLDVRLRTSLAQGLATTTRRDGYEVVRRGGRLAIFPAAIAAELAGRMGPRPDAMVEAWNGVPFLTPLWFRGPRLTILHHVHADMWPLVLPGPLARAGWLLEGTLAPPLYRHSTIVTNSGSSRDEIVSRLGLPAGHIEVVPPGIDPRWRPDPTVARHPRPLVVAVGRLVPHKHFDTLIRVAAEARLAVPDLELVIVGEGYERPSLEGLVASLGAEAWVSLPGRVDDEALVRYYREAWVVGATSNAEGFGMTLTEAAACGTPAVATDIAGHRDAVLDGESGLLATTPAQLATHLVALLTDEGLRTRLTAGALRRAAELTWEATATAVFDALATSTRQRS